MADYIKAEIKGLSKLLNKLGGLRSEAENILSEEIETAADDVERMAKQNATSTIQTSYGGNDQDFGQIRNSIRAVKVSKLQSNVEVGVPGPIGDLAVYVEVGTGKWIDIPQGFEAYFMQWFKNGKGTILPQPYLFPALEAERKVFIERLKASLKAL